MQQDSLPSQWQTANTLSESVTSITPQDGKYEVRVQECLDAFLAAKEMIRQLGLFSPNETLEDIQTADLRYASIDYQLGDTTSRLQGERNNVVEQAEAYYRSFLDFVRQHQLLTQQEDIDILKAALRPAGGRPDPASHRAAKIQKFKRERTLRDEYMDIYATAGGSLLSSKDQTEDDDSLDESRRQLFLKDIAIKTIQAADNLDMLAREQEMLIMQRNRPPVPPPSHPDSSRLDRPLLNQTGPLLNPQGQPVRPFVITSDRRNRQDIQAGVFRPHWNLPTMSIDEYLDKEAERGNILSGGGPSSGQIGDKKEKNDEEEDADDDVALKKKREWDEFKDDNPKGWGNRGNKG